MLAWRQDPLGMLLKHLAGVWALAVAVKEAVQWGFRTTEAASKQSIMSWTGEARVITKGDLGQAFAEATSVQKGEARLLVKSDLDGLEQRIGKMMGKLDNRLGKLDNRLGKLDILFGCSFVLHGVTLWTIWTISKKK